MRSYQMYKMFSDAKTTAKRTKSDTSTTKAESPEYDYTDADVYQELKIGQLAQRYSEGCCVMDVHQMKKSKQCRQRSIASSSLTYSTLF